MIKMFTSKYGVTSDTWYDFGFVIEQTGNFYNSRLSQACTKEKHFLELVVARPNEEPYKIHYAVRIMLYHLLYLQLFSLPVKQ